MRSVLDADDGFSVGERQSVLMLGFKSDDLLDTNDVFSGNRKDSLELLLGHFYKNLYLEFMTSL
jgi:hypothetical protein